MRIISPSLLNKLTDNNQTTYNNSDPRMNISLARARSSVMDSSYFTVETIRTKAGIGDISIGLQRLNPYGPPNAIYEIHIDNGIAKTSIRKYPDKRKEGWKDQFEVGPASSVAICFDGRWIINSKRQWQIVTKEKPYIFYIKPDNNLFVRLWDNEEEFLLGENIKKVKAIRGWKSTIVGTDDHGIIAAYIKNDGKVYYRNLCEQEDGRLVWELERQIVEFSGIAVNLNLFITNDYRTGIIIEDNNGKITWFITSRNWAGMAIAADTILARSDLRVKFIETTKYYTFNEERIVVNSNLEATFLYASGFNEFVDIENIDDGSGNYGKFVRFNTRYGLKNVNIDDFLLIDSNGRTFVGVNKEKEGDLYIAEFMNFNNARGEVQLVFKGIYATNDAGYKYEEFVGSFTPINLAPVETPAPEVTAIYNVEVQDW